MHVLLMLNSMSSLLCALQKSSEEKWVHYIALSCSVWSEFCGVVVNMFVSTPAAYVQYEWCTFELSTKQCTHLSIMCASALAASMNPSRPVI
jgi:hypothetical protein